SESHETNDSLDVTPATAVQSEEPDSTAPGFDVAADLPAAERNGDSPAAETAVVRPLSEAMLDQDSDLVVGSDDDTVEIADSPLMPLAPLLLRPDPLTWVFAGARLAGDSAHDDGRLAGEWFAEEWRAETGRATD